MTKRRMLVVGYPKSGNTWLTRLAAELLGAPVKDFGGSRRAARSRSKAKAASKSRSARGDSRPRRAASRSRPSACAA